MRALRSHLRLARRRLAAARLARRTGREPRLGIATRLSIAFTAVAILTVAANQIAERDSALKRALEGAPAAAVPDDDPAADALPAALDEFQRAVLARVESQAPIRVEAHAAAATALDQALRAYVGRHARVTGSADLASLESAAVAHVEHAAELVRGADARRRLVNELRIELEGLATRMQAAQERVWALFGRVIAREYVLEANRLLERYSASVSRLASDQDYDTAAVRAAVTAERALSAQLSAHAESFGRTFGADWLPQTRSRLGHVAWLRKLLVRTDGDRHAAAEAFAASHAALSTRIRKANAAFEAARALAHARQHSAEALHAASAQERQQRRRLAWLSAGVLLLLLAISVTTVTSVVRPVRRLESATRRIANGESGVTVPRGGIKELDRLAVSFNQMAERLAIAQELAREYHGQLEAKVQERTRQLQHLAAHDPLTRLPNRRQFLVQLESTLARLAGTGGRAGIFFLDLDNFKNVNDSMGHVFGDRVLQAIAERVRSAVEGYGYCARLGGDEFTVVYEPARHALEIEHAADALVRAFQHPLVVDGRELLMGLSVGASIFPEHGRDPETLLRAADAALFHAKAQGRSRVRVFSPELLEAAASRFSTEQGLRRAVERGEFELHFQPEVDLVSREVRVVEALLRWRLPDGSHASPQDFLPVAEDCGFIREIGDWVVRSTIEHAARWRSDGWPEFRVAVNVSALQLLDARFADGLGHLLVAHRLPPDALEVELTENVLQTGRQTTEALAALRELGVGVALDDFGTGYSSLVSLQQLPLSRVKLDRGLIATIDTSARSQAVTRAIIALCQSLDLDITAEGVEREAQLAWLFGHRAMQLQGYLLSPPVPASELLPALLAMPSRLESLLMSAVPRNAVPLARIRPSRSRL